MIAIDGGVVVLFILAIVGVVIVRSVRSVAAAKAAPNAELARAARWMERALAVDAVSPVLPTQMRQDGERILADYYKELSK